jgi:hypothetical protein
VQKHFYPGTILGRRWDGTWKYHVIYDDNVRENNVDASLVRPPKMFVVEQILARRVRKGKFELKIKWKGWKNPTWEPEENLGSQDVRRFC